MPGRRRTGSWTKGCSTICTTRKDDPPSPWTDIRRWTGALPIALRVSDEVRRRRLPTPRVVAAAVYPSNAFYRGDLVTVYVPDSFELAETLFDPRRRGVSSSIDRREVMAETGRLADGPLPRAAAAMYDRLVRSIRKLEKKTDLRVAPGEVKALAKGLRQ